MPWPATWPGFGLSKMADRAISVEQSAMAVARKRRVAWAVMSTASLVLVDIAIAIAAFILAFKFRSEAPLFRWRRGAIMHIGLSQGFQPYFTILMFVPFVKLFSLRRFGLYRSRGEFSFQSDFANVFKASTLSFLVLVLVAFLFRQGFTIQDGKLTYLDFSYSRLVFVVDWVASVVLFCMARACLRTTQVFIRFSGRNLIPTIVVGCGDMAQICVAEMSEKTRLGYKLVGVVTADSRDDTESMTGLGVRVLGEFDCRRKPKQIALVISVGQQAAFVSEETPRIDSRQMVATSQQDDLCTMDVQEAIRYHNQATIVPASLRGKDGF